MRHVQSDFAGHLGWVTEGNVVRWNGLGNNTTRPNNATISKGDTWSGKTLAGSVDDLTQDSQYHCTAANQAILSNDNRRSQRWTVYASAISPIRIVLDAAYVYSMTYPRSFSDGDHVHWIILDVTVAIDESGRRNADLEAIVDPEWTPYQRSLLCYLTRGVLRICEPGYRISVLVHPH